jgi:eukaryotic-like serine/threonine-protein kinase
MREGDRHRDAPRNRMTASTAVSRIDRYEVESLAGEGATAKVYRARDTQIGRTVAIKVLKQQTGIDQDYLNRFQREVQLAGTLSHPNIVTIYDVGRFEEAPYITMEFLDEKSLECLIAGDVKLPVKRVIAIAIQLARALDYAHRRGVIHRDVKPANILLIDDVVKLTDFGIAHLDNAADSQCAESRVLLGTPRYMSPEQVAGQPVDGRSDLFSLGAVLYEMLTGRKAFDSEKVASLMLTILQQNPAPMGPDVPVGMQRIVRKLMSKRPDRRFATGAQLAEALEKELEEVIAQEEELGRNKFMPLRVKLTALSSGILAMLFLLCMSAVYFVEAQIVRNQVFDSGASLAKFVAVHSAVPVLDQDWIPLQLFVQDARARTSLDYLVVTDHADLVEASTEPKLVGKRYQPPLEQKLLKTSPEMTVSSVSLPGGRNVFLFNAPILFQKTEIGHIFLGINQAGVTQVLNTTFWLMAGLGVFATIIVGSLSFLFARFIARPLRVLRRALQDFGAGDLDRRISESRNDEFGEVFQVFNAAADGLQRVASKPEKSRGFEAHHALEAGVASSLAHVDVTETTLEIEVGGR